MLRSDYSTFEIRLTTGNVSSSLEANGGKPVTQHGHVYSSTNPLPTLTDSKTELGPKSGPFPSRFLSQLTNLSPATTYTLRAYATNEVGTAYGSSVITFRTETPIAPILSSQLTLTGVSAVSIGVGFNIGYSSELPITQHGLVYSTTDKSPSITNPTLALGPTNGPFNLQVNALLKDLTEKTTYYVRGFATNAKGTSYTGVLEVTTN
ncbi:MAG: hypothetical protein LH606_11965 [Cytophagaceae bacterium]|nr:hypothetical protein [Cytophagaceae bacterium]